MNVNKDLKDRDLKDFSVLLNTLSVLVSELVSDSGKRL